MSLRKVLEVVVGSEQYDVSLFVGLFLPGTVGETRLTACSVTCAYPEPHQQAGFKILRSGKTGVLTGNK